ncbi:MAG: PAS domain-containing sensor histidine kinase [Anaerolineae bacterium]|nr:PAS domain-containing sensor histidine kinase [Thermoflexales bacterium]MDW8406913.1 PAS domain-containing sensor histidine kinase [Anaerolineae bacterium]
MNKHLIHPALRLAVLYTLVAGLWIVFSDYLLGLFVSDLDVLTSLQSVKGLAFVLVMAAILAAERLSAERAAAHAAADLQKAEYKFRSMFSAAPVGIFRADAEGRYLDANPAFASMLGYDSPAELIEALNTPGRPETAELSEMVRRLAATGTEAVRGEQRCRRKDDRWIDVRFNMRAARGPDGSLLDGSLLYVEGFVEDVSAERAVAQKLQQFADVVNASDDAIIALSVDGLIRSWNPGAQRIYGYSASEAEGCSIYMLWPAYREAEVRQNLARLQSGQPIRRVETEGLRKSGAVLDVAISASPICDAEGVVTGISMIVQDITERKALDRRLQTQQAILEEYASQLVRSQEEERRRLSRLLHDETMQDLVALTQRIELCRSAIDRDSNLVRRRLDELQELSKSMVASLRWLSNDLRPLVLEDLGLAAAVHFLSDDLAHRMPYCVVRCEINGRERRLPADLEVTAFRIIQAALGNIRHHSPTATSIEVILTFDESEVHAVVKDNGPGFQTLQAEEKVRDGQRELAGMQARARLFGGHVAVESTPGYGTTVVLRLPISTSAYSPLNHQPHLAG